MSISQGNINNLELIESKLCEAEETLKQAISLSLEEVNNIPNVEKELFSLWKEHANNLRDYFIYQAEKSGNSTIGKNIYKFFMFKRL